MSPLPRYLSLDILRGLSVAGMILVNNPGVGGVAFPALRHVPWVGCTLADLVFPFFIFIVGAAMAFSLAKYESVISARSILKLLTRGAIIFIIGLLLNAFPFYPINPDPQLSLWENFCAMHENLRIFGVLQRIALCYVLGGFIAMIFRRISLIALIIALLIGLHTYLLMHLGNDSAGGYGGAKGVFSLYGQGAGAIDTELVGKAHVYQGYGLTFDPEGLLGTITAVATLLMGYIAGKFVRAQPIASEAAARLTGWGLACLILASLIGNEIPMIKGLWTGSYVLHSGGWAMLTLAALMYFVDIRGRRALFYPFKTMGINPLFAYIVADLLAKSASQLITWTSHGKEWTLQSWYYWEVCVDLVGKSAGYSSLLYSTSFLLIILSMCLLLHWRRIVIKL